MSAQFSLHKEMTRVFKSAARLPMRTGREFEKGAWLRGDGHVVKLYVLTGHHFSTTQVAEYTGRPFETFLPPATLKTIGASIKKSTPEWLVVTVYETGLKIDNVQGESLVAMSGVQNPGEDFMLNYITPEKFTHFDSVILDNKDKLISQFADALKVRETKYGYIHTFHLKDGKEFHANTTYLKSILNFLTDATKGGRVEIKFYTGKSDYKNQTRICSIHVGDTGFGVVMGLVF